MTERFSLTYGADRWHITTERATGSGAVLTIEAEADGVPDLSLSTPLLIRNASLTWAPDGKGSPPVVSAQFTVSETELDVVRNGEHKTTTLLGPSVLSPLARITMGPTLLNLANTVRARTIVPWFHDPSNTELLFTPRIEDRRVERSGAQRGSLDTPDGVATGQSFQYAGGNYDEHDVFIVSDDGLLLAYSFADLTIWRVDD